MGVELEDPEIGNGRGHHLDDGQRRRVIAPEHDGEEAGMPEPADFLAGPGQLLTGTAAAQLAVAQVGHAEIFQIPLEDGRVGLDGVRRDSEVPRASVGSRHSQRRRSAPKAAAVG